MNALHFLSSSNFRIVNKDGKALLYTDVPGFALILFYTTDCPHCSALKPIFHTLPGKVGGCHIGMVDVKHNKQCILMSRQTTAPITVVPYVVLYVNGKPYMRYKGPASDQEIVKFVITVAKQAQTQIQPQQSAQSSGQAQNRQDSRVQPQVGSSIPAFTIAQPKSGDKCDGVCYLDYGDAYDKSHTGPESIQQKTFFDPYKKMDHDSYNSR